MTLPSLNEFYVLLGIVSTIVVTVYLRIRGLEKENDKLKKDNLDDKLKGIDREIDNANPDDLVDRANEYWKDPTKRNGSG